MHAMVSMYWLPELAWATEIWWDALRRHWRAAGLSAAPAVSREPAELYELWLAPDLFFAQTCGYPLTHKLRDQVALVATPCYAAPGCEGPTYRSFIIVHEDSGIEDIAGLAGKTAGINGYDSQSGWNVLRRALAPVLKGEDFPRVIETGAHRKSVAAVCARKVDVAAIDCVTYALLRQVAPQEIEELRVIAASERAPSLPYITRKDIAPDDLQRLRAGLQAAMADPDLVDVRRALLLSGVEVLPESAYAAILDIEAQGLRLMGQRVEV
jgi:ABC-type phosphate/phosphonate transport system substrate-binding protein